MITCSTAGQVPRPKDLRAVKAASSHMTKSERRVSSGILSVATAWSRRLCDPWCVTVRNISNCNVRAAKNTLKKKPEKEGKTAPHGVPCSVRQQAVPVSIPVSPPLPLLLPLLLPGIRASWLLYVN